MKNYPNFTEKYVLYEMSYSNIILYSSILPSFENSDEENGDNNEKSSKKKGLHFGDFLNKMKGLRDERNK